MNWVSTIEQNVLKWEKIFIFVPHEIYPSEFGMIIYKISGILDQSNWPTDIRLVVNLGT